MNIPQGTQVRVYWNLHRKTFSVQKRNAQRQWRVAGHAPLIYLDNATFKVSQAGNARVREEGRKNVHAYVIGEWVTSPEAVCHSPLAEWHDVEYNPYKYTEFMCAGDPIGEARHARLQNRKVTVVI